MCKEMPVLLRPSEWDCRLEEGKSTRGSGRGGRKVQQIEIDWASGVVGTDGLLLKGWHEIGDSSDGAKG